ncbi:ATP-binding protein [Heyndrickxia faecalis]|uniref:ATP-binding protein n=1 Tax=Heyndrickxia TaxID=2837504 RepID=UPI003D2531AF
MPFYPENVLQTSDPGLGMAITKQLVELHGGSINVKSEPGKGTAVRILLPILP